jgi:hypothetical protein
MTSEMYISDPHHYVIKDSRYFYLCFLYLLTYLLFSTFLIYKIPKKSETVVKIQSISFANRFWLIYSVIILYLYSAFYDYLYSISESFNLMIAPISVIVFLSSYTYFLNKKKLDMYLIIGFLSLFFSIIVRFIWGSRYVLLNVILGLFFVYLYIKWILSNGKYGCLSFRLEIVILSILLLLVFLLYLDLAFFVKKRGWIEALKLDKNLLFGFGFKHLWYRSIEIYSNLSSIIMEYVDKIKGSLYGGITYFKFFLGMFGVKIDDININVITAKLYQGYGYAQPGIVGESYVNFGLFGPLILGIVMAFMFLSLEIYLLSSKGFLFIGILASSSPNLIFNAASPLQFFYQGSIFLCIYLLGVLIKFIIYTTISKGNKI